MAIPCNIRLAPGQIVMVEFGPDPRQVAAPGIMTGPLGVRPEMYKERHCVVVSTTIGLTTIVPLSTKRRRAVGPSISASRPENIPA
jgi:uncharacterized protein YifN (PemK superfamily)